MKLKLLGLAKDVQSPAFWSVSLGLLGILYLLPHMTRDREAQQIR